MSWQGSRHSGQSENTFTPISTAECDSAHFLAQEHGEVPLGMREEDISIQREPDMANGAPARVPRRPVDFKGWD